MRTMLVVTILAFMGCASNNEMLLVEATACGKGPECQEIWDEWNRNEERITRRQDASNRATECNNSGGIMVYRRRHGDGE